jgi:DNA-binding MarR family transcriptional regulator
MLALLYVARMDRNGTPASIKEVGEYLGLTSASASRNIAVLSKWSRHNKPGHDLVEAIENPEYRSQKLIKLTAKGKRVIKSLEETNDS